MQLTERLKSLSSVLRRRAKQLLTPFAMEDLARQILAKDISLLRHYYLGMIPRSLRATDLAAYLELHDATDKLLSEHSITEGFHLIRAGDIYLVAKTVRGRRLDLGAFQHVHAALIVYCEHILLDLRHHEAEDLATKVTVIDQTVLAPSPTKTSRLRLVSTQTSEFNSMRSRPRQLHLRVIQ
jgi:hypothetical protein